MSDEKPNRLVEAAMNRARELSEDEAAPFRVRLAYLTIADTYRRDIESAATRRQAREVTNEYEAAVRAAKKAQANG